MSDMIFAIAVIMVSCFVLLMIFAAIQREDREDEDRDQEEYIRKWRRKNK